MNRQQRLRIVLKYVVLVLVAVVFLTRTQITTALPTVTMPVPMILTRSFLALVAVVLLIPTQMAMARRIATMPVPMTLTRSLRECAGVADPILIVMGTV